MGDAAKFYDKYRRVHIDMSLLTTHVDVRMYTCTYTRVRTLNPYMSKRVRYTTRVPHSV